MKRIIKKFDLVHFLSQEAFEAFTVYVDYRLSIDKVYIGKHPNYSSAYIETNPISDLRGSLNIPLESIVIGYVGMIKPYKNLIMLLDAYLLLKRENSNLYLLIAGSNFDKDFDEKISKLAITDSNIKYIPRYVADSEIASYVKMLDVAVFPFDDPDEILNSGSLILSLSFCVQSVIPNFVSLSSFSRLSSVTTFEYGVLGSLVYSIQFKIDNYRNRKVVDGKFLSPDMSDWLDETSAKRVSQDFFHHVLLVLRKREIFKVGDSSE
jgi:glycosyltransferase involved in cell wall biosynthesis